MRFALFVLTLALFCAANAQAQLRVEEAFPGLTFQSPVGVGHDGVDENLLYIVEQRGVIRVVDLSATTAAASDFLDIQSIVSAGGEKGLLGLAFHPDYETNGYFYVYYSTTGAHRSRVSRFTRNDDIDVYPPVADTATEVILLEEPQPFSNHNGGGLAFGDDGYLYISLGDGGSGGDPLENGEDNTTLLGAILRIDVDGGGTEPDCGGSTAQYTVPDNVLANGPGGACDEIYSWGLRNPWRFSFDRDTGELWIADVGQNQWEEIDLGVNGGNYGWNMYEGNQCFDAPCNPLGLIFPVWEYSHSLGCSITGGYVYRGATVPELDGRYVYGDFCSGRIWGLDDSGAEPENAQLPVGLFGSLTSFGEDFAGELYFTRLNGRVYRFFSDSSSSGEPGAEGSRLRLDTAFPNPFSSSTEITFALGAPGPVRLAVYDVLGREVAVLREGTAGTEAETVRFGGAALADGVYVVRLESGTEVVSRTVVLTR